MTESLFSNPTLTKLVVACLLSKLGGRATITQADIDEVSFHLLNEYGNLDGSLGLELARRPTSS